MHNKTNNYNKLSEKIDKSNFYAFRERNNLQKSIRVNATASKAQLTTNTKLLKVIIAIQLFKLALEFPAVASLFTLFI